MKKVFSTLLLLIFIMAASVLSGCGGKDAPNGNAPGSLNEQRQDGTAPGTDENVDETVANETNEPVLAELAALEKEWGEELHKLVIDIDGATESWIYGDAIYNNYIMDLYKIKSQFDTFYEKVNSTYEEKDFANKLKDEPQFTTGFSHGPLMRDTVKDFFAVSFEGVEDESGNIMDVSGEEFKKMYEEKMIKGYNDQYRKIIAAIRIHNK